MKKNKIFLSLLLAASVATGCRKELNEEPFNSMSDVSAFSSPDRIDKAAVGMYDALQNANFFSGRVLIYTDIRGIDATPNSFFGQMHMFNTINSADGTVASAYQAAYRTIYETNLFVKNFTPKADIVTPELGSKYLGEAKYIRSLCYFYLVNLWAQPYDFTADASHPGVVLTLEAAADPFSSSNNVARSTVKQVYDQIEADLLDAESKLPLTSSDPFIKTARATKGAARALLMRLYLYKKDYNKALAYANTIINSNEYTLRPSPEAPFRSYTTRESIFSVAFSGGDNPNTNNAIGQHYGASRRGDISVSDEYLRILEQGSDKRFLNLIEKVGTNYWSTKYNAGTSDYVPVSRYAEVLLTKAEALAHLASGVSQEAVGLINQIRTTAGAGLIAPGTKQDLIDFIIRERRIELAFEGHGILEFLRTKRGIPAHSNVPAQAWGSNYVIFPIPKYDTDKNKDNLAQNPGY